MPAPVSAPRRLTSVLRQHRLFASIVLVALAIRVVAVIAYRPAFFFTGDSVVYLDNAFHLVPGQARPILYAVFLRLLLFGHRLILVPILQHLIGLATGCITYALLVHLGVRRIVGVLGSSFVLFDPLQIVIEHNILSDCLFEFFVLTSLAVLVWRNRPSVTVSALTGLGLAAATLDRNVGLVLIVPVCLYCLMAQVGWIRLVTLMLTFALPLCAYAGWFDSIYGHFNLENYDGLFLYGRVAPFADCIGLKLAPEQRLLCPPRKGRSPWPTWYVFGPPSPFLAEPLESDPDANQLALNFDLKVIRHQPGPYITAVGKDFLEYFAAERTGASDADPVQIDFIFRLSTLTAYPTPQISAWIRKADHSPTAHGTVVRPLARALHDWQQYFYFPGPVFAGALLLGFAPMARRSPWCGRWRGRQIKRISVLFALSAGLLLLAPVATVVMDYRFLVPTFPLLGVTGALGACSMFPVLVGEERDAKRKLRYRNHR